MATETKKVTLPTFTTIVAVEGEDEVYGLPYPTYDSVHTGVWVEQHERYGWPEIHFALPDNKRCTITLAGSDLKKLVAALAALL